jgi:hypothetical protein
MADDAATPMEAVPAGAAAAAAQPEVAAEPAGGAAAAAVEPEPSVEPAAKKQRVGVSMEDELSALASKMPDDIAREKLFSLASSLMQEVLTARNSESEKQTRLEKLEEAKAALEAGSAQAGSQIADVLDSLLKKYATNAYKPSDASRQAFTRALAAEPAAIEMLRPLEVAASQIGGLEMLVEQQRNAVALSEAETKMKSMASQLAAFKRSHVAVPAPQPVAVAASALPAHPPTPVPAAPAAAPQPPAPVSAIPDSVRQCLALVAGGRTHAAL